jgi:hypothetical protein
MHLDGILQTGNLQQSEGENTKEGKRERRLTSKKVNGLYKFESNRQNLCHTAAN